MPDPTFDATPDPMPGVTPDNPAAPRRPARPEVRPSTRVDGARRPVLPRRGAASADPVVTGDRGGDATAEQGNSIDRPAGALPLPSVPLPVTPPTPPSAVRSPVYRRTLLPSCVVVGGMAVAVGVAGFFQPADAALRQLGVAWPAALIAVGVALLAAATLLSLSLRDAAPPRRPH